MAIKINSILTTKSGLTIPSGSVVSFDVTFPALEKAAHFTLNVYLSEADLNNGKKPIRDRIEQFNNSHYASLLKSELAGSGNPLPILEAKLKDYIEEGVGVGTCEIIDVIPAD